MMVRLGRPVGEAGASTVRIRSERDEGDVAWLRERGIGISGLVLAVRPGQGWVNERLGAEGSASTILLEEQQS